MEEDGELCRAGSRRQIEDRREWLLKEMYRREFVILNAVKDLAFVTCY